MLINKPSFYNDFKCIADNCKDSCCIGWEIDVDEAALEKYKTGSGEIYRRIRDNLTQSADGSICFKLLKGGRCPFLNENGLCDIISSEGEDAICEICREHPRFYEWFPNATECGLGLCCEEVCRLLLKDEKPFSIISENDSSISCIHNADDMKVSADYVSLWGFRNFLFDYIFSEEYNYNQKVQLVLGQTESYTNSTIHIKDDKGIVKGYELTEPINEQWKTLVKELSCNLSKYKSLEKEFDGVIGGDMLYSKILAYIIYRHLIKAVYDGGTENRIVFSVEAVRFIKLTDIMTYSKKGELTLEDRVENLKMWSKQIEYSEENTDFLIG